MEPKSMPNGPAKPVIVIGAGAAGITVTYRLRRAGVEVVCLEASDHPCGRTTTIRHGDFVIQTGALGIEPQWKTEMRLLDELGMRDQMHDVMPMRMGFWRKGRWQVMGMGSKADKKRWKASKGRWNLGSAIIPAAAIPGTLRAGAAMMKEVNRLKKFAKAGQDPHENYWADLSHLDQVSLKDYVLEHGSPLALQYVFGPAMNVLVNTECEDIGVAHMITLMYDMLTSENTEGGAYCALDWGMGSLYEAAYSKDKDCYRFNARVREVVIEDGAVRGVVLDSGERIEADEVICATTATKAMQIIPGLPAELTADLSAVQYSPCFTYMLCSHEQFVPDDMVMGVIPNTDEVPAPLFKVCFNEAAENPNRAPAGSTILHLCTTKESTPRLLAMTADERKQAILEEARMFFPAMPAELDFFREEYLHESISRDAPGQHAAILNYYTKHKDLVRGLYLAGEYLYAQASAEGAAHTGEEAARMLLECRSR